MSNLHVSIIPYCFKQSNLYTFHFKMVIFFTINFYGAYFYMETKCSKKNYSISDPNKDSNDDTKKEVRTKKWPVFKGRVGAKMTRIESEIQNKKMTRI